MATATKKRAARAKSGQRKLEVTVCYHDPHGELQCECPQCGKVWPDTRQVCECGFVLPIVKKRQAIAKAFECDDPVHALVKDVPATEAEAAAKEAAAGIGLGKLTHGPKRRTPEPAPTKICNRCNQVHEAAACPDCGCPEYRLEEAAEPAESVAPPAAGRKAKGKAPDASWHIGYGEMDIDCASIVTRPDNPRQTFDPQQLAALARSIEEVGLINRVIVRLCDGGHELWAGECRLRAVRDVLGRATIPCKVYAAAVPDAKMQAIRAWENLQREDLDPLEEARCLAQLLESGAYANQRDLAAAVGISQTELSMRVRLAELPAEWREQVIAHGKTEGQDGISTSHAKHLFPWLGRPQVLAKALKLAADWSKGRGRRPNEKDFAGIVDNAVRACTRTLSKPGYCQHGCEFKVTPELKQQLDVIEVTRRWGGGKESRAFNRGLYDQHQKAAKARKKERAAKAAAETPAAGGKKSRAPKPPAFQDFHFDAVNRWAGRQIAARLGKKKDGAIAWKLCLLLIQSEDWYDYGRSALQKQLGVKSRNYEWADAMAWWRTLQATAWPVLEQCVREFVAARLSDGASPDDGARDGCTLLAIAGELGADLETEWQPAAADLAGWPFEALRGMADQFDVEIPNKALTGRKTAEHLSQVWQPGNVPKEILAAAGIKA